jgi:hypothetical protein
MTLKKLSENYMADTPRWAKVVRLVGLVAGAAGGAILTSNHVLWPVALIAAAPYMVTVGNFTALFVQSFKK